MSKRTRASGKVVNLGSRPSNMRATDEQVVLRTKEDTREGIKRLINLFIFFTGLIVVIVLCLYVAVSSTLMNFTPVEGRVVWSLYGIVPHAKDRPERFVVASANSAAPTKGLERAKQSLVGVQKPFTAQVVSEKYGDISSKKNVIYVNGKKTSFKGKIKSQHLNGAYLVKCVSGNCEKGQYFLVPEENIVGNIYGYITSSGLKQANE